MNRSVVEQAEERLELAQSHYDTLANAESFKEFRIGWSQFLIALNTVFSKLEQGVKGDGPDEAWFGRVKHQRRKDPLLQYLHQARNSDEHGIHPIAGMRPPSIGIGRSGETITNLSINGNNISVGRNHDGSLPTITHFPARPILVEVVDSKHGDRYQPPRSHLGSPIFDPTPELVGELGLKWVRQMLAEARGRVN